MENLLERMKPEFSELLNIKSDTNLYIHQIVIECLVFNYFCSKLTIDELINLESFTHPLTTISIYEYLNMFDDD
jgi:hypothetical protein